MKRRPFIFCTIVALAIAITGFAFILGSNKAGTGTTIDTYKSENAPHASWIGGSLNFDDLIKSSDVIITGRVIGSTPEQRFDLIFTRQEVSANSIYKGEVKEGESVIILQTGGRLGEMETRPFQEAPLLVEKSDYLLFLEYTPEGYYLIMGGFQGVARIINNELEFNVSDDYIANELYGMSYSDVTSIMQSKLEPNITISID